MTEPFRRSVELTGGRHMDRIYRALSIAVALGTSGLMFALTLA
jgi:hypothetical protein